MQVHISITLDEKDRDIAFSVLEALHPETATALAEARHAESRDAVVVAGKTLANPGPANTEGLGANEGAKAFPEGEKPRPGTAAALLNDGKSATSNGEIKSTPTPAASKVDPLVRNLYSRFKKTQSGTGAGGVQLKITDEVFDEQGQVGIVRALVRGKAVIEYDDGTGAEVETSTLSLYVAEEQSATAGAAATEAMQGEVLPPEDDAPSPPNPLDDGDDDGPTEVVVTRDDIRALAQEVMDAKGASHLYQLLLKNTGAGKVKDIPEGQLPRVHEMLQAALAAS